MKKGFFKYVFDSPSMVMAFAFVVFSPMWIWFLARNGFNWLIVGCLTISFIGIIHSYITFNPEKYNSCER